MPFKLCSGMRQTCDSSARQHRNDSRTLTTLIFITSVLDLHTTGKHFFFYPKAAKFFCPDEQETKLGPASARNTSRTREEKGGTRHTPQGSKKQTPLSVLTSAFNAFSIDRVLFSNDAAQHDQAEHRRDTLCRPGACRSLNTLHSFPQRNAFNGLACHQAYHTAAHERKRSPQRIHFLR